MVDDFTVFNHPDPSALERQQHQMIDFSAQAAHDALELEKIEHELVRRIELAVHGNARPVIVPVKPLATMAGVGDEMGGRKDEVVPRH